ncbi:MAG: hypothetical protein BroJett030_25870 [Alphaproteobacteria bacterium]|nr:MAG: hypothetical protein BroJett030_25870 [Alphaproteobacteria bacterium]
MTRSTEVVTKAAASAQASRDNLMVWVNRLPQSDPARRLTDRHWRDPRDFLSKSAAAQLGRELTALLEAETADGWNLALSLVVFELGRCRPFADPQEYAEFMSALADFIRHGCRTSRHRPRENSRARSEAFVIAARRCTTLTEATDALVAYWNERGWQIERRTARARAERAAKISGLALLRQPRK